MPFSRFPVFAGTVPSWDFEAVFLRFVREDEATEVCASDPLLVAVRAPVTVALHVTGMALRDAARVHGVVVSRDARRDVRRVVALLKAHECRAACSDVVALFSFDLVRSRGAGSAPERPATVSTPDQPSGADRPDKFVAKSVGERSKYPTSADQSHPEYLYEGIAGSFS